MGTTAIALFADGRQLTDVKHIDADDAVDVLFSITSRTWPLTVNQYGEWGASGFGLRDLPVAETFEAPGGTYRLQLTPPSA